MARTIQKSWESKGRTADRDERRLPNKTNIDKRWILEERIAFSRGDASKAESTFGIERQKSNWATDIAVKLKWWAEEIDQQFKQGHRRKRVSHKRDQQQKGLNDC